MTSPPGPKNISKDVIEALKGALTDATLVDEGEGGFRVSTVGSPHVTGCATSHEPGGGVEDEGGKGGVGGVGGGGSHSSRASACSFALDVKGALRAVPAASSSSSSGKKAEEEDALEVDGAFHVARIVSDAEFEGGIGPLNVETKLDDAGSNNKKGKSAAPSSLSSSSSAEAAIEKARGEIARRIVEAVSSVVKEASESSPRKKGGGEKKEKEKEQQKEEVKVGGEAA